jgi:hypothetical protein
VRGDSVDGDWGGDADGVLYFLYDHPCHITSFYIVSVCAALCCAVLCYLTLCCVTSCHVALLGAALCCSVYMRTSI